MRGRPEPRDLRSLDRRRLYSIFAALDTEERLPREQLFEGRSRLRLNSRRVLGVAGALYLPGLVLLLVVLLSLGLNAVVAFAIAGAALAGVYLFALAAPGR